MRLYFQIIICILISLGSFESRQTFPYDKVANLSTIWINSDHSSNFAFTDSTMRAILVRTTQNPSLAYACGFISNAFTDRYLFSVAVVQIKSLTDFVNNLGYDVNVVWSANRNRPVYLNATFQLTSNGNMALSDSRNELVWSTNTAGRDVAGLNLTETGNLVLFDVNNIVVWQSFDHPTDSLLPEQKLGPGQKLIASVSEIDYSEGLYSYAADNDEVFLYVGSEVYYHNSTTDILENGSLMKLGWDGHLTHFLLDLTWKETIDVLEDELSDCQYPMVCGEYGVCQNGVCSCPQLAYFSQVHVRQPNLGCSHITPLECNASHLHTFVEVLQASYFTFGVDISNTDRNTCKKACLTNCSCKAAMFRHGDCYLPTKIYSFMGINDVKLNDYGFSIDLKVQITPERAAASKRNYVPVIIGFTIGILLPITVVSAFFLKMMIWNRKWHGEVDNDEPDILPIISKRFSFKDLMIATKTFSIKIGEGTFGSVFQGSLKDGTKIVVKFLDRRSHIDNLFLTEVESIGNIHHVNMVRLVGYCAEKSHRLLIYEYIANGSLQMWLDDGRNQKFPLDWNRRKNIVIGIAKGLAYLHEDCRQKILHLDVNPRNILLDENYNAKLCGFGHSKLLSRDQSKIFATLRGTPGYLAPEWLSSIVTEKVDVYSFGVVVMEILCGRKVIDISQKHEDRVNLISMFARKEKERKLLDMMDEFCEDMQSNGEEALKMMQVAAWCMQNEYQVRPSMSYIVKVLEDNVNVDFTSLDYDFISPILFEETWHEGQCTKMSL